MSFVSVVHHPDMDIADGLFGVFDFDGMYVWSAGNSLEELTEHAGDLGFTVDTRHDAAVIVYTTHAPSALNAAHWGLPDQTTFKVQKCVHARTYQRMINAGDYLRVSDLWGPPPPNLVQWVQDYNQRQQQQYVDDDDDDNVDLLAPAPPRMQPRAADGAHIYGSTTGAYGLRQHFPIDDDASGLDPRYFPGGRAEGRYKPVEPPPQEVLDLFP